MRAPSVLRAFAANPPRTGLAGPKETPLYRHGGDGELVDAGDMCPPWGDQQARAGPFEADPDSGDTFETPRFKPQPDEVQGLRRAVNWLIRARHHRAAVSPVFELEPDGAIALSVLVEARPARRAGFVLGTACRYVAVEVPGASSEIGRLIPAVGAAIDPDAIVATRGSTA